MKGRKSPRILRIKARSYSNVKSNPIVCDDEDSEHNEETDTELSLSTDRANTISRMDTEIERQLEESRQKKLKKKEEKNKMVKESRTKKLHERTIREAIKSGKEDNKKQMVKTMKKVKEKQPKTLQLVATCEGSRKRKNEGVEAKKATNTKRQKTNEGTQKGRKKQAKSTKKTQKLQKEPLLYSLRTRSSPRKLHECLWSLNERQKEIVKDMGFGKLLSMVVNGIPGRLGYFVVDNFNPETMEIKFGRLSIKVDEESIHQLLGVPNSGIDLTNFEVPKDTTPLGMAFKTRHGNKLTISTSTISKKITMGKDNEGFMFKVDFIVLFMNTMVECHINGLCKTGIVDILNEQMDFSKINWCKYIVNIIKRCKKKWVPRDFSSFFRGALTTLTLLYVDSVTCKGINEVRTVNPLKFWTMQRLQLREDMELKNGGFGRGDFRGLFVDESSSDDDTSEESEVEKEEEEDEDSELEVPETKSLEMHFREIGTYYYWLERNKANFEKAIAEIQSKFPKKEAVEIFVEQYKEKFRKLFNQNEAEKEQATEKHCLDLIVHSMDVLKESEAATPKTKGNIDEEEPTFSLGISGIGDQLEEENNGVDAETQQSKEAPQLLSSQPSFSLGISQIDERPQRMKHPTYASKSPFIIREVDICKQLTKEEVRIWNYLMESSNGQLFQEDRPENEGKSDEKKHTCMQREEEKEIQTDFEDDVFETISGHTTKRFLLRTLKPGETVLNNVIDCWAAILNHDEELRGPDSNKRLFCDTSVMSEDMLTNGKMDEAARLEVIETSLKGALKGTDYEANLKNVELVLIPILEKSHYYLICFDLQNLAIEVIDNIDESKSFVGLQDNEEYSKKDTVLKVKHMFIVYLKSVGNSKWEDLEAVVPVKLKLTWATKKNSIDCGVFLMRHMETYKESCSKNWECGIKTEKSKKQKQQLNLLRKKYAVKIVLSKANIHRESVIDKAVKFEKEKNESTKCDPK